MTLLFQAGGHENSAIEPVKAERSGWTILGAFHGDFTKIFQNSQVFVEN